MDVKPVAQDSVTLFLCGDVMTGRGVDQILPYPSPPLLEEPDVSSAHAYVEMAERAHGLIVEPVDFGYVWGDALAQIEQYRPAARIANLETAVVSSEEACSGKAIHYRMNPRNVQCLRAAGFDCFALANNHTMDFGREGLEEMLQVLREAGFHTVGAGPDIAASSAPVRLELPDNRGIVVFSCGTPDSGISCEWEATEYRPGLCVLDDLSTHVVDEIAALIDSHKRPGDIAVMSVHWGRNWGYEIDEQQCRFAHMLIDRAGIDVVHGHSAHHPKAIEVYRGKLILYGCGDLLNDYEGIDGNERYRPDLGLMYFPEIGATTGELVRLTMVPTCVRRMRVIGATHNDACWLAAALNRECSRFATILQSRSDGCFELQWPQAIEKIA